MSSFKDDFLSANARTATVAFRGKVFTVREFVGDEWDQFRKASTVKAADGSETFVADRALAVQLATVGDDGGRLFAPEDLPKLRQKNSLWLAKMADKIAELSGLGDDAGNG